MYINISYCTCGNKSDWETMRVAFVCICVRDSWEETAKNYLKFEKRQKGGNVIHFSFLPSIE